MLLWLSFARWRSALSLCTTSKSVIIHSVGYAQNTHTRRKRISTVPTTDGPDRDNKTRDRMCSHNFGGFMQRFACATDDRYMQSEQQTAVAGSRSGRIVVVHITIQLTRIIIADIGVVKMP